MAGQPGRKQASFASGELEDILQERRDLKAYASGLKYNANSIPLPQGPLTLRDYTRRVSRVRRVLAAIPWTGTSLSAPAGGTAANVTDASAGTTLATGAFSGTQVVFTANLPAPQAVAAVDLTSFLASVAGGTVQVQFFAGSWMSFNEPRTVRTVARSRRFAAPPDAPVTAAQWRVVVTLPTSGTFTLTDMAFWTETGAYSVHRLRAFSYSAEADYELVLSEGNGDVFKLGGGFVTAFALPVTGGELAGSRWLQQLNTALLFRRPRQTVRIFRENADLEWQVDLVPYANLPLHDFGDIDYTNSQPAVWDLQFVGTAADSRCTVTVEGEETEAFSAGGDLVGAVAAAINKLPSVQPGVIYTAPAGGTVRVTFAGEGNEGQVRITSARVINKADAALAWIEVQKGREGGETLYSDTRGWPGAGAFYQQRLVVGGSTALGNAWLASMTGDYYNMNTEVAAANGPMLIPMDTKGAETIEEILVTRALLIFTTASEYWVANQALTKAQPPNPVRASSHGIAAGVPVVENEGASYFIARNGNSLVSFAFNEVDQIYATTRESLKASHLVKGVVDQAIRRSAGSVDCNIIFYTQADGAARMVALLKEQDTIGFSRIETDGQVLAFSCGQSNVMSQICARQVDGEAVRFLERYEPGLLLDQAVTQSFDPATDTVTGLAADFEGASVWAIADDEVYGPFTVEGGALILPVTAEVVTVGRWMPLRAEVLPPSREVGPQIVTESDVGYHTVRVSLKDTTSLAIGANSNAAQEVPLLRAGAPSDIPSTRALYTGKAVIDGLQGALDDPVIVITQLRPGYLTLRSVTGEADI